MRSSRLQQVRTVDWVASTELHHGPIFCTLRTSTLDKRFHRRYGVEVEYLSPFASVRHLLWVHPVVHHIPGIFPMGRLSGVRLELVSFFHDPDDLVDLRLASYPLPVLCFVCRTSLKWERRLLQRSYLTPREPVRNLVAVQVPF